MTLAWQVARIAAVVALLGVGFALLPPASLSTLDPLTIPSEIWDPIVAVLHLDRYFPIHELLIVAVLALTIQAGLAGLWLVSWLGKHLLG